VLGTGHVSVVLVRLVPGVARGFVGTDGFVCGGYVEPWFNVVLGRTYGVYVSQGAVVDRTPIGTGL